jgi:hypothetical protein
MAAMRFHRGRAGVQQVRDFLVRAAFGDHLQDLTLAVGEQVVAVFQGWIIGSL